MDLRDASASKKKTEIRERKTEIIKSKLALLLLPPSKASTWIQFWTRRRCLLEGWLVSEPYFWEGNRFLWCSHNSIGFWRLISIGNPTFGRETTFNINFFSTRCLIIYLCGLHLIWTKVHLSQRHVPGKRFISIRKHFIWAKHSPVRCRISHSFDQQTMKEIVLEKKLTLKFSCSSPLHCIKRGQHHIMEQELEDVEESLNLK